MSGDGEKEGSFPRVENGNKCALPRGDRKKEYPLSRLGNEKEKYFAAVRAGIDRNYLPMMQVFSDVVSLTLRNYEKNQIIVVAPQQPSNASFVEMPSTWEEETTV
jgi:hypothetical protein